MMLRERNMYTDPFSAPGIAEAAIALRRIGVPFRIGSWIYYFDNGRKFEFECLARIELAGASASIVSVPDGSDPGRPICFEYVDEDAIMGCKEGLTPDEAAELARSYVSGEGHMRRKAGGRPR